MKRIFLAALACTSLLAQPALAEDQDDAYRLLKAQVPMSKAIQATEHYFKGRAFAAEIENDSKGTYWKIKLLDKNARLIKVYVDSKSGRLIGAHTYGTLPSRSNNRVADDFLKDYPKNWADTFRESLNEHFKELDEFDRHHHRDLMHEWAQQSKREGWTLP